MIEHRPMLATSLAIHVVLLVLFPLLLADFGRRLPVEPKRTQITFYRPHERPPDPTPPPVEIAARPTPAPAPMVERPRPTPVPAPPRAIPAPAPEKPIEVAQIERRIETPPAPVVPRATPPPAPKPQVRSAGFVEAATSAAPPKPSPREVRTAGFGVSSGPTTTSAAPVYRGSARIGGFEVPSAPEPQAPVHAPRGRVTSTGFDTQEAQAPAPRPSKGSAPVSTGGFGDTVVVAPAPARPTQPAAPSPETPVEILSKPKPNYTDAARARGVEGEVVLEVVFGAAGQLRVLRVVRGLGYGLDEAAAEAARQITFEPARRSGAPVDHTAMLRIVFQLA